MSSELTLLVVAKAPVAGRVKTRLAADLGGDEDTAADLAAAALLDTIEACAATAGPAACRLALAGDLTRAARGPELTAALTGWAVVPQRGDTFGERLVHAHAEVAGPVLQVGMDTPQIEPALLRRTAAGLAYADAVLAPATDGGWWALALRDGRRAAPLRDVAMSTPSTRRDTRAALAAAGLRVATAEPRTDLDRLADLAVVTAQAPASRLAAAARALGVPA